MVPTRFRSAPFRNSSASWCASAARFSLSLLAALALVAGAQAEKPSPSPKKDAKAAKDAKGGKDPAKADAKTDPKGDKTADPAETTDESAQMMGMMIPGKDVKGMSYAHRDENDKVVMEFRTEVARKLDDENIEMEKLSIVTFDDEGKQINIDLPLSVFNVNTRILTGKDQIVIKRDDFEIVGETGEFNTKTRFAKMLGDVKMTILNTDNFDQ